MEERVLKLLSEEDITLTEEEKKKYIPQFVQIAEEQLGGELVKRLEEPYMDEFEKLFSNLATTEQEWSEFWNRAIPNFLECVNESIEKSGTKIREALKKE